MQMGEREGDGDVEFVLGRGMGFLKCLFQVTFLSISNLESNERVYHYLWVRFGSK